MCGYCGPECSPLLYCSEYAGCSTGLSGFFRCYYYGKSADWAANNPQPLTAWSPLELAKLPDYYVIKQCLGMAETVFAQMVGEQPIAPCEWLTDEELAVYAREYQRNAFHGGLQWYRCGTDPAIIAQL
jgi:hypothetical protein